MDSPLYFDYQASTPVDPRVCAAMLPWLQGRFGNPHAAGHSYGQVAHDAVEHARAQVAAVLNAQPNEIIFTSGATESNNLAIKGAARFALEQDLAKRHIITVATEHRSVLESCADIAGFDVTVLPVKADGLIDVAAIDAALREDTLLVSVMAVNNEIGVVQPLAQIGALCRKHGVYFHTDAAQAFGKIALDVEAMQIDLLSISGHKAYAPQGVGALYLRRKPRVRLHPLFSGGGQERALRAGTVATPLVVALGEAAALAQAGMDTESKRMAVLHARFLAALSDAGVAFTLNGSATQRFAGNINLSIAGVDIEALQQSLPNLACSFGSACSSGQAGASHVLRAIGAPHGALRIGLGRFSSEEEVSAATQMLVVAIQKMKLAA